MGATCARYTDLRSYRNDRRGSRPLVGHLAKNALERFFDIASSRSIQLVSAVSYEPPPPHHFCRRPRNVLLDPPEDLTVEVEKLIEVNRMAID
ncbi:hypothetical protein EVAR_99735_1 [Eumeta japonica]|uniref:Uncharacterized protein n=1 Tax=Eumeta variegata TaxID=151549 RepID=A0A4C1Z776_EUMVA|nr:hypothetical protein EVAR_99735_1 [Eumeta japonica]